MLRAWGSELATGDVLSTENVERPRHGPRRRPVALNWGAHGDGRTAVWFWSNAWNIPTTSRSATTTILVTFTLDSGKAGAFDYVITIIP